MTQWNSGNGIAGMLALLAVTLASSTVWARTVVECREPDGTVSFRDHCAPDAAKTGEKHLRGSRPPLSLQEIAKNNPVVLYTVPDCDTCDLVRLQLQSRAVPFSEKDVSNDPAIQQELTTASGALTVPTVLIGHEPLQGYDRAELHQRLTAAGYPAPAAAPATAAVAK